MLRKRTFHHIQYIFILLFSLTACVLYHVQKELYRPRLERLVIYEDEKDLGIRDPSVTCQFPLLHPFHPSILGNVGVPPPIRCMERIKLVTFIDDSGVLRFNGTALAELGYKRDGSDADCKYSEIRRRPGTDFGVEYGPELKLTGMDLPNSDFVYVQCTNYLGNYYVNFHASARRNSTVRRFKVVLQSVDEVGVVVLGLDSLSRLNFMRQLSKSFRFVTDVLGGVVLYGFNKVGENTFPNVVPMLTGRPPPEPPYDSFEEWPLIWKAFAREGAATMYAEDLPDINTFVFRARGLRSQPTHHYMRPYWLAAEDSLLYKLSSPYCLGPTPKHKIFFDYLTSFLRVYKDSPTFLFSLHNELTHDYVNAVGAIDDDLVNFLNASHKEGLFNRSVVFILGDHGNRLDRIRGTEVGQIEDKMPLVAVILPEWVRHRQPRWHSSLTLNSNRLVSTYDLHATFVQILDTVAGAGDAWRRTVDEPGVPQHFRESGPGLSILEPVPADRSCPEAGVPDWVCACLGPQERLSPSEAAALAAANATVTFLNDALAPHGRLCAPQVLSRVESALLKRDSRGREIVEIMLWTSPSSQLFEATVTLHGGWHEVSGGVRRINPYGRQADCLPDEVVHRSPQLKGICYCKSKL